MGKLMSGILGNLSGKVAGVVGGTWKGQAYIRAYAKPGNPNTDPQKAQRTAMRTAVAAAKPFVSQICNPFTDRFVKGMSGFNWIVKNNIKRIDMDGNIPFLLVAAGSLHVAQILTAVYTSVSGAIVISWDTSTGVNGLATDMVVGWVRNKATNEVWFPGLGGVRTDTPENGVIPTGLTLADLEAGTFTYQLKPNSPTIVANISNSTVMACTVS